MSITFKRKARPEDMAAEAQKPEDKPTPGGAELRLSAEDFVNYLLQTGDDTLDPDVRSARERDAKKVMEIIYSMPGQMSVAAVAMLFVNVIFFYGMRKKISDIMAIFLMTVKAATDAGIFSEGEDDDEDDGGGGKFGEEQAKRHS